MKVYASDYGDFKMYVSDFKIDTPGYIWIDSKGWYETKITYVESYDIYNTPTNLPHKGDFDGEFITDDGCYWICVDCVKEIPEDDVDIEVIGYC